MTLPVITVNYQKKATSAKFKKVYSTFTNALRRSVAENGDWYYFDLGGYGIGAENTKYVAETYIMPYLNVGYHCEYGKDDVCNYKYTMKNTSKSKSDFIPGDAYYSFALTDGTTASLYVAPKIGIFRIMVGLNGPKKPNIYGRDVFDFYIMPDDSGYGSLKLIGRMSNKTQVNRESLKRNCKNYSMYCSELILIDGFEIKDDYPW